MDEDLDLGPSAHGIRMPDLTTPKMDIHLPQPSNSPAKVIGEIVDLLKSIDKNVKEINAKLK